MIFVVKWKFLDAVFALQTLTIWNFWASWPRKKLIWSLKAVKEVNGLNIENGSRGRKDIEDPLFFQKKATHVYNFIPRWRWYRQWFCRHKGFDIEIFRAWFVWGISIVCLTGWMLHWWQHGNFTWKYLKNLLLLVSF